jgi:phage tail-like protein
VDPYRGYNFVVQIDQTNVAGFREVSGLTSNIDPVEYREGIDPVHVRKLTGLRKFANIVLKRGFTQDKGLWDWYRQLLSGEVVRRNGSVVLRDELGAEVLRWNFRQAWICKWEGPMMNATANDVAIESLELCVEEVLLG